MVKNLKYILLVLSTCLCLLFTGCGKEATYETTLYDSLDVITDLDIDISSADVKILVTEGNPKVECREADAIKHTVETVNGTLIIRNEIDNRFAIDYDKISVTVYLPKQSYGHLYIKNASGHIDVDEGLTFSSANIVASSGNIEYSSNVENDLKMDAASGNVLLSKFSCGTLNVDAASGDVKMTAVVAAKDISIHTSSGDILLNHCDANNLDITASSGNVVGTLLTPKTFDAVALSGSVHVPQDNEGGKCKIRASSGNIDISISNSNP